ncbi:HNH endonuclease signature motif containing protein [Ruania zhangjianzhongii]|uniref:HNH endonuclease signature motif containing protein n=1 Tax=Ruania zhangjianzhongii TaxID=2603206 RepID=UPI0011CA2FAE|nr:HNH endonuclease signature motif containing protein [Ruania zhangjianzhongii]
MNEWTESPTEPPRPVAELADELGSLAAEIAAHTARFLHVLAEFDAQQGWQQYAGMCSSAHWLSWRCGISASTAREHVRIARALSALPLTDTEFAAGRLSYSKVRAITRVGTAANEDELVQAAKAASAVQLDRLCAGIRTGASLEEINAQHRRRRLSYRVDDDGSVCLSIRSAPEDGAVIVEALRRAQDYLEHTETAADHATASSLADDLAHTEHTLLDALVLICEQSSVGPVRTPEALPAPKGPGDCVRASRRSETVLHATLNDLADAAGSGITGPHLELGPALHPETARRLSCDTGVVLQLHEDAPAGARREVLISANGRSGRTIDLGRRHRRPNAALFRALWDRDQGCVFPGCGRRRYLHARHLRHWALGGPTTLQNMALLCGQHHRRHHEGGFELRRGPDGTLHTYSPDGTVVEPVPASAARSAAERPALSGVTDQLTATDARPFDLGYAVSTLLMNRRARLEAEERRAA